MRRSLKTKTLVIVSDHTKSIYEDRWIGELFHYTGMGLRDNQTINSTQNKTLAESPSSDIEVFLFEVFQQGNYLFQGRVELADHPYQEKQPDIDGILRNVWIFPLKQVDETLIKPLPETVIIKKQEAKEKEAAKLPLADLEKRAKYSKKGVGVRQVTSTTFERNVYVTEFAKRRAKGVCQLCDKPAPFNDKRGIPFLESHHIVWLSKGGEDTIENTVALCPNCHRKMHTLNSKEDINKLNAAV
jgi:5-methylcytosine-specific restriction protein A